MVCTKNQTFSDAAISIMIEVIFMIFVN